MNSEIDINAPHTVTCDRCGVEGKITRSDDTMIYECDGWGMFGKGAIHPDLDLCPHCLPQYVALQAGYFDAHKAWMSRGSLVHVSDKEVE